MKMYGCSGKEVTLIGIIAVCSAAAAATGRNEAVDVPANSLSKSSLCCPFLIGPKLRARSGSALPYKCLPEGR